MIATSVTKGKVGFPAAKKKKHVSFVNITQPDSSSTQRGKNTGGVDTSAVLARSVQLRNDLLSTACRYRRWRMLG